MQLFLASIALLIAITVAAKADRPVTDPERVKLQEAVTTQGCSGGKMEWDEDDRQFEVDDATCNNDGCKYDQVRFRIQAHPQEFGLARDGGVCGS
jgi:hypothetical protein